MFRILRYKKLPYFSLFVVFSSAFSGFDVLWYLSIYLCHMVSSCVKFSSHRSSSIFFIQTFFGMPQGLVPVISISITSASTPVLLRLFTCPNHLSLLSAEVEVEASHHTCSPLHYWPGDTCHVAQHTVIAALQSFLKLRDGTPCFSSIQTKGRMQALQTLPLFFSGRCLFVRRPATLFHFLHAAAVLALTYRSTPPSLLITSPTWQKLLTTSTTSPSTCMGCSPGFCGPQCN